MATVLTALGLFAIAWLVVFQILLVAGAPLGHLAWGGTHRVLPKGLRIASLFSVLLLGLAGLVLLRRAGYMAGPLSDGVVSVLTLVFAGLFTLSVIGNIATQSRIERLHGVPMSLLLVAPFLWFGLIAAP